MPARMPPFGSAEFKRTKVTMFLRKQFVTAGTYQMLAAAVAHELSHVVLNSIGHPLRTEEEAVDLTAMILGYRDIYVETAFVGDQRRQQLGYLSSDEVRYAAAVIARAEHEVRSAPISAGDTRRTERRLAAWMHRWWRVSLIAATSAIAIGCTFLMFWIPASHAPANLPGDDTIVKPAATAISDQTPPAEVTGSTSRLSAVPLPHLRPHAKPHSSNKAASSADTSLAPH